MMDFCLPDLGEGIVQAEFVQWLVKPGDRVSRGQNIAEVMTDKAAVELPSPVDAIIDQLMVAPGETVDIGSPLAKFESLEAGTVVPASKSSMAQDTSTVSSAKTISRQAAVPSRSRVAAAPSVRRMARRLGVDLSKIQGSGPNNRVLIGDLPNDSDDPPIGPNNQTNGNRGAPTGSVNQLAPGTRVPLQGLRRTIAQRLSHASQTIPHFSYIDEVDVSDLFRIRQSLKEPLAAKGIKLTYLPFFVKACVGALKEVPQVNASLDADANEIVLHDRYHIGIATDTPAGLLVPVIHDADQKKIEQIAKEIDLVTTASRLGKASLEQLKGSTFTVTSTGGIGGLISTPIINEPAVGILGIGQIVKRPRFDEHDNIRAAHIVYLSFSFDHRVVDGADAARFANALIQRLTNPAAMLV